MFIKNALHIPTCKQNIFSVQAATKNGAHISFERNNCQFIYTNRAALNLSQRGRLYYLKNIVSVRNATYHLHKILGQCKESDTEKDTQISKRNEDKTDTKLCS